jgi:hypothetical protein
MGFEQFTVAIFVYCRELRGSVTSWIRTTARNHTAGGVIDSPHTFGLAVDVVYDVPLPYERASALADNLGLAVIREKDHDHIQPADWRVPAIRK